jgi:hypothetical protein
MRLLAGDPITAHVAGKTGRGTVLQDQRGDVVIFRWDDSPATAPPVLARRDRVTFIPPPEHATTPVLTEADLIESIERRYDV